MSAATKTGRDAAKSASKRVVQKTTDATGDLIKLIQQVKQKVEKKKRKQINNKKFKQNQKKGSKLLMT